MVEQWCPVVGFEGYYEVSDHGRVRSVDRLVRCSTSADKYRLWRGRIIKPTLVSKWGHVEVRMSRHGQVSRRLVHHLVLEAFVGSRPEGGEALHWDDTPANNYLSNLRWGTSSENKLDCVRNGTHYQASKTHCALGHEYTPENTYRRHNGGRTCRKCNALRGAVYYQSQRTLSA